MPFWQRPDQVMLSLGSGAGSHTRHPVRVSAAHPGSAVCPTLGARAAARMSTQATITPARITPSPRLLRRILSGETCRLQDTPRLRAALDLECRENAAALAA